MSAEQVAERVTKTVKRIDALVSRALALADDGDRAPYFVRSNTVFRSPDNTNGEMLFNIPADADFYGKRLDLFLSARTVSTASPTLTDLTYRPVDWTPAAMLSTSRIESIAAANCVFFISDSMRGAYQLSPIAIPMAFSARAMNFAAGLLAGGIIPVGTPYLGGLDFHTDYVLKRGSSMSVVVTPLFSHARSDADLLNSFVSQDGDVLELRVVGLLQGYKKVKALR